MSSELLKRLGIGLGVLVVLWIGMEFIRGRPSSGVTEIPLVADTSAIDSVVMHRPMLDLTVTRSPAGVWTVNGFRADSTSVSNLTEALAGELRSELVAENQSSHGRFSIGDDEAKRVTVYVGGNAVLDLLLGKRGRDFQSAYVRRPGDDEVYAARTQLATLSDRALADWRDKRIANVAADSVAQIEAMRGRSVYTIARADSGRWNIDGQPADSAAVQRMLTQYSGLNGAGFPTEAQMDSVDLESPDREVTLRDARDNIVLQLAFDSSSANGFWVRRTGDSTVFRLDRFRVDQLIPADSTLRRTSD